MVAFFQKGDSPMKQNRKGFTLIELLIVIVIIGILVAVLIAVINPARARNRAKDAGIEAAMSKVGLAVQGYMSAYGTYPDCPDLMASIDNEVQVGTNTTPPCVFRISGVSPSNFTYTTGSYGTPPIATYWLATPAIGLEGKSFVMHSREGNSGKIYACTGTTVTAPDPTTLAGCQDLTTQ